MPDLSKLIQDLREKGFEATIGLEVHVQLNTQSKIFAGDPNLSDSEPNTDIGVISLGHPGTLPVLNKEVLEKAILMGLACGSSITRDNHFARKSYFYPDLPKGYQTTQDKTPICVGGNVEILGDNLLQDTVSLHHIHMEEDAGKSIHDEGHDTWIDLNRAGSPLIEIVTNPSILGPDEAAIFLQEIRRMVRFLGISEANMEKGELRCDANISIKPIGSETLGRKVEIKNMNSFNHVRRAISFEIERQLALVLQEEVIEEETRTFDPATGKTSGMRFKETMNDYRYFPCPDLPPMLVEDSYLEKLKAQSPKTPAYYRERFAKEYQLSDYDVQLLADDKETAEYFLALCEERVNPKKAANWINGPYKGFINEIDEAITAVSLSQMTDLLRLMESGKLMAAAAQRDLLPVLAKSDKEVETLAKELNLLVSEDSGELESIVDEVLLSLPVEVESFKKGKKKLMGLFMGEVMKKSRGKANPKEVQSVLNSKLK